MEHYNVLFLCTGNSARSILAEAIMNHKGRPNFTACSAGSHPSGAVRPEAIAQLERAQLPTGGLRSKSWDEFAQPGAPRLDFVFTVCDNAASEVCPIWPGQPMTAHWGVADPAAVRGSASEIERVYRDAFATLDRRIGLFLSLPLADIDELAIKKEIDKIGKVTTDPTAIGPATIGRPTIGRPAIGRPAIGRPTIGHPTIGRPTTGQTTIGRE